MKSQLPKLRQILDKFTAGFPKNHQATSPISHSNEVTPKNGAIQIPAPQERPPDPKSAAEAHTRLHQILHPPQALSEISNYDFILGWVAMAYIAPCLNPDEAEDEEGGWPQAWQPAAVEAFRRFESKEITKEELYPRPY
ncbi:MAG: hypothetical protein ACI9NQ_001411 [Paracoccaceae bacterium]|jgi:hypothetical protein